MDKDAKKFTFKISKEATSGGEDFLDTIGFITILMSAQLEEEKIGYIKISLLQDKDLAILKEHSKEDSKVVELFYLNKPMVRMVEIYESNRGKKLSIELYKKAQEYLRNEFNLSLYSDKKNWIRESALSNWNHMVSLGIATEIEDRFFMNE